MGKVGVYFQEWQTTVNRNQAALGRVNSLKQVNLKQTDLKQFRFVPQVCKHQRKEDVVYVLLRSPEPCCEYLCGHCGRP